MKFIPLNSWWVMHLWGLYVKIIFIIYIFSFYVGVSQQYSGDPGAPIYNFQPELARGSMPGFKDAVLIWHMGTLDLLGYSEWWLYGLNRAYTQKILVSYLCIISLTLPFLQNIFAPIYIYSYLIRMHYDCTVKQCIIKPKRKKTSFSPLPTVFPWGNH